MLSYIYNGKTKKMQIIGHLTANYWPFDCSYSSSTVTLTTKKSSHVQYGISAKLTSASEACSTVRALAKICVVGIEIFGECS